MFKGGGWKNLRLTPKPGGLKYHFTVVVHELKIVDGAGLPSSIKELVVVWNRGAKVSETKAVEGDGETFSWEERLSMLCTMYRDEKDNGLQYKKAKFVIKGGEKGGKLQSICSCKIDLARYASVEHKESNVVMQFEAKDKPFAELRISISSVWMKDAKMRDTDGMSNMSISVVSSANSGLFDDDDEEEDSASRITDDSREGRSPYISKGFPPPLDPEPVIAYSSQNDTIKSAFTKPFRSGGNPNMLDHVPGERHARSSRSPEAASRKNTPSGLGKGVAIGGPTKWEEPSWGSTATCGAGAYAASGANSAPQGGAAGARRQPVVGELRGEVERLEREVMGLREDVRERDLRMQDMHIVEHQLRQQLKMLKEVAYTFSKGITSMEVELHEYETKDVLAEETERLTLAYVPVIRQLTQELEATKADLAEERQKNRRFAPAKPAAHR